MKREKFLWPLTQSHHRALLAARRIRESLAASPEDKTVVRLAGEVKILYESELRSHFQDEEVMADRMEAFVGKDDPDITRMRQDHRRLESLVPPNTRESLSEFAEMLKNHVRFEEDVLFGRFEGLLDDGAKEDFGKTLLAHSPQNGPPKGP